MEPKQKKIIISVVLVLLVVLLLILIHRQMNKLSIITIPGYNYVSGDSMGHVSDCAVDVSIKIITDMDKKGSKSKPLTANSAVAYRFANRSRFEGKSTLKVTPLKEGTSKSITMEKATRDENKVANTPDNSNRCNTVVYKGQLLLVEYYEGTRLVLSQLFKVQDNLDNNNKYIRLAVATQGYNGPAFWTFD